MGKRIRNLVAFGALAAGVGETAHQGFNKIEKDVRVENMAYAKASQQAEKTAMAESTDRIGRYEKEKQKVVSELVQSGIDEQSIKIDWLEGTVTIPDSEKKKTTLKPDEYEKLVTDLRGSVALIKVAMREENARELRK